MKNTCRNLSSLATFVALVVAGSMPVHAQGTVRQADLGRMEYQGHCAICHGDTGTGNGEMRKFLTLKPADLTSIAKRNGGTFPQQKMWEVVDGRATVQAHGTREMPVWGQRFRVEALGDHGTTGNPEYEVRNRITALVDYLSQLQAK